MYFSTLLSLVATVMSVVDMVEAKAVFAHYMIGNAQKDHIHKDIDDAAAMGLDGFALNIGDPRPAFVRTSMNYMFDYARGRYPNFKLFVSMDLWAAGDATPKQSVFDYHNLLRDFMGHPAYQRGPNNFPFVSTFSDGGLQNTVWTQWRQSWANQVYLVPDFDGTAGYYENHPAWWAYWGGVVDGLYSWESSWPFRAGYGGQFAGDVSPDEKVIAGTVAHGKSYMIGLSPLQYKNSYNTNIYRAGELNLPKRMENILRMSPSPDYVQIQTWNDGPESHYVGNLWSEQNTDAQPGIYATELHASHAGWQPIIASFSAAFKAGASASSMTPPRGAPVVGAMWYKTILQSAVCPNEGSSLYTQKPDGFGQGSDWLNWAIVLPPSTGGWSVFAYSGNIQIGQWSLSGGLNYGAAAGLRAGLQRLEVRDATGKAVKVAAGGKCVSAGCPDLIYNMNPQVVALGDPKPAPSACPNLPSPTPIISSCQPPPRSSAGIYTSRPSPTPTSRGVCGS